MKCLTGFMRKGCERRRSSEIRIANRVNDLGTMYRTKRKVSARISGAVVNLLEVFRTELFI